jgi:hypothetical protein
MSARSIRPAAGKSAAGAAVEEWERPELQAGALQAHRVVRLRQAAVREHRAAAVEEALAPEVQVEAGDGRTDHQLIHSCC